MKAMPRRMSRNETTENAVEAMHKLTGLVGIDTERIHDRIRRSQSTDERCKLEVRVEAKQILEKSLARKTISIDDALDDAEIPSLNQNHVQELLDSIEEREGGRKAPRRCTVLCELIIALPLEVFMIYFGYTNLDNCPVAIGLPQWLLILGSLWSIRALCTAFSYMAWKVDSTTAVLVVSFFDSVANTLSLLWGLIGLYLIWGNWDNYTWEDRKSRRYCAHSVMIVSKFLVVFFVVGWIVVMTGLCCCCLVSWLVRRRTLGKDEKFRMHV